MRVEKCQSIPTDLSRPNLETHDEIQFEDIYSENIDKLNNILNEIEKTWDTRYTNGRMKK